ncbi:hypothetical protein Taro_001518 [Colocasia esculenta]|uniref:Uncharacterized protein n=1 Tax=Colocasia esculenta TaxID=4460 RepID=A0A843TI49_COLES|nr:hypothetical protein [Colocasia esculenta]
MVSHAYKNGTSGDDDLDLPLIDFSRIAAATAGFSAENKLGQGGFGPVYVLGIIHGATLAFPELCLAQSNLVVGLEFARRTRTRQAE